MLAWFFDLEHFYIKMHLDRKEKVRGYVLIKIYYCLLLKKSTPIKMHDIIGIVYCFSEISYYWFL